EADQRNATGQASARDESPREWSGDQLTSVVAAATPVGHEEHKTADELHHQECRRHDPPDRVAGDPLINTLAVATTDDRVTGGIPTHEQHQRSGELDDDGNEAEQTGAPHEDEPE